MANDAVRSDLQYDTFLCIAAPQKDDPVVAAKAQHGRRRQGTKTLWTVARDDFGFESEQASSAQDVARFCGPVAKGELMA